MSDGATERHRHLRPRRRVARVGGLADPLSVVARLGVCDSVCAARVGRAAGGPLRRTRLRRVDDARPGGTGVEPRDLAADVAALVGTLGADEGLSRWRRVGGMVAQVAALDYPDAFSALMPVSTCLVVAGPVDEYLPDHDMAGMNAVFSSPMPDWTNRAAFAAFVGDGAEQQQVVATWVAARPAAHRVMFGIDRLGQPAGVDLEGDG